MRDDKLKTRQSPGESLGESRRGFLKLAGVGTLAAGAAAVTGQTAEAADAAQETGDGYRETKHVKTYYALARF